MKTQFMKFALAASIGLALAFTFSCSGGDDENPGSGDDGGNTVYGSPVTHGGKTYKTVVIGNQTWMAENLAVSGGKCYGEGGQVYDYEIDDYVVLTGVEIQTNCDKYGRLYDWATAMGLDTDCNSSSCASQIQPKHKGIRPKRWHIPSNEDWDELLRYVDNDYNSDSERSLTAAKYLKAKNDWNDYVPCDKYFDVEEEKECEVHGTKRSGNGTDDYGFSALPGGVNRSDNVFADVGEEGNFWSASESNSDYAYHIDMVFYREIAYRFDGDKSYLYSIRCVKD